MQLALCFGGYCMQFCAKTIVRRCLSKYKPEPLFEGDGLMFLFVMDLGQGFAALSFFCILGFAPDSKRSGYYFVKPPLRRL
jgi:hypothetical protein